MVEAKGEEFWLAVQDSSWRGYWRCCTAALM